MMKLKKILVPVDFSKEAEFALEWAIKLGKEEPKATLYLLHSLDPLPVGELGLGSDRLIQSLLDNAKQELDIWKKKVPFPLSVVTSVVMMDAVHEIGLICERETIDLIVMTTKGRQGLSRLVHPNMSEKVVRTAPCPVLVLHLNEKTANMAVPS